MTSAGSHNQPVSLHVKADEMLKHDARPKPVAAPARHQGRDFTFQQEDDAVGVQGTIIEDFGNGPG